MAWPDFSLTDLYTSIITKLNTGFTNASKLFRDQASGDLTNQIRYSSSNKRLEYWTGSAWAALDFTGVAAGTAATATSATSASSISGYSVGNASGNIPVSNGVVCTNLNAEKIGGLTAAQIQAGSVNWDTVAGAGLANSSGVLSVNTSGAISKSGDNVVLLYDNLTIKMNGSNQIYAEVPSQPTYAASDTGTQVNPTIFTVDLRSEYVEGQGTVYWRASANDIPLTTPADTWTKMVEYMCPYGGTLYSSFALTNLGTSQASSYGKIYVNGVAVGTEHSTGTTGTKADSSIAISQGDLIQLFAKSGASTSVEVKSWALKSNSAKIPLTLMYAYSARP